MIPELKVGRKTAQKDLEARWQVVTLSLRCPHPEVYFSSSVARTSSSPVNTVTYGATRSTGRVTEMLSDSTQTP